MNSIAKTLILLGAALIVCGVLWQLFSSFGNSLQGRGLPSLGRLPGDIAIEKPNVKFYFPITSSLLISIILSAIFLLIRWFSEKK